MLRRPKSYLAIGALAFLILVTDGCVARRVIDFQASYWGSPQFLPIEGAPIDYAANTSQKILRIDYTYYVWMQGSWLTSDSADGPWELAGDVPRELLSVECGPLDPNRATYQLCAVPLSK